MFDVNGIVYASVRVLLRSMKFQYDGDDSKIRNFANTHIDNCMLSFGEALHSGGNIKNIQRSVNKIKRDYNFTRSYLDNNIFIDSGGFQIQMEMIEPKNIPYLIDGYCNFIDYVPDSNTYFFIEDVIPTQKGKVNREDALKYTIQGMKQMSQLSEAKRKNIYFVYHFQSPNIFDLWQEVLKATPPEEYLGGHRWAVGGIVSNSGTANDTSFISYMIPMQDILQRELEYLKKGNSMYFHILGVTGFLDILFYTLFEELLKKYNMNVSITFDSTSAIMTVCRANAFTFWETEPVPSFYTADLRPAYAHKGVKDYHQINKHLTNNMIIQDKIKYMQNTYGFKGIETHIGENGRMVTDTQYIFMLYQALSFKKLHAWCKIESKKLIDMFFQDKQEFGNKLLTTATTLRSGRITRYVNNKCTAIFNTIKTFNNILSHEGADAFKSAKEIKTQINTLLQSFEAVETLDENKW